MKNNELERSLKDIIRVGNSDSWFRGDPHRWAVATLPMAYASACVEVVIIESQRSRYIYDRLVKAWGKANTQKVWEEIQAELSESDKQRINEAFLHPEKELSSDPNKPFRDLEKLIQDFDINDLISEESDLDGLSAEDKEGAEEFASLVGLVLEFILVGFNRESDVERGRFKVIPSREAPWLIVAVMVRSYFDYRNITLEMLRKFYKLRKYKGKIVDFHKVLTEEPMSRWHRRMVADSKVAKLKLKNDRIFVAAARSWYQSRIVHRSINEYCDAQSEKGMIMDLKNLQKQVKPCDEALGYVRRLPKKID
jgi:hypothetical protein